MRNHSATANHLTDDPRKLVQQSAALITRIDRRAWRTVPGAPAVHPFQVHGSHPVFLQRPVPIRDATKPSRTISHSNTIDQVSSILLVS